MPCYGYEKIFPIRVSYEGKTAYLFPWYKIYRIFHYMILYNPNCTMPLIDFGILIPSRYDKQERVYEGLKNGPLKEFPEHLWHRTPSCRGIEKEDLLRVHTKEYVNRLYSPLVGQEAILAFELIDSSGNYNRYDPTKARRPLSDLFIRALANTQGTYETCTTALETGFAYHLGGGSHHAMPDHGAGFCMINDLIVALRKVQAENRIQTAWIIDVDAHKGDGTAVLTKGDSSIRTLSIHMAQGWPLDTPEYGPDGSYNLSYTPSDIDIGIFPGEEDQYVSRLAEGLKGIEQFGYPDLALVVDGSDPFEGDELPSADLLKLSENDLFRRDLLIYHFLEERSIPSAWVMAGGYGKNSWKIYVNFLGAVLPERLTKK